MSMVYFDQILPVLSLNDHTHGLGIEKAIDRPKPTWNRDSDLHVHAPLSFSGVLCLAIVCIYTSCYT